MSGQQPGIPFNPYSDDETPRGGEFLHATSSSDDEFARKGKRRRSKPLKRFTRKLKKDDGLVGGGDNGNGGDKGDETDFEMTAWEETDAEDEEEKEKSQQSIFKRAGNGLKKLMSSMMSRRDEEEEEEEEGDDEQPGSSRTGSRPRHRSLGDSTRRNGHGMREREERSMTGHLPSGSGSGRSPSSSYVRRADDGMRERRARSDDSDEEVMRRTQEESPSNRRSADKSGEKEKNKTSKRKHFEVDGAAAPVDTQTPEKTMKKRSYYVPAAEKTPEARESYNKKMRDYMKNDYTPRVKARIALMKDSAAKAKTTVRKRAAGSTTQAPRRKKAKMSSRPHSKMALSSGDPNLDVSGASDTMRSPSAGRMPPAEESDADSEGSVVSESTRGKKLPVAGSERRRAAVQQTPASTHRPRRSASRPPPDGEEDEDDHEANGRPRRAASHAPGADSNSNTARTRRGRSASVMRPTEPGGDTPVLRRSARVPSRSGSVAPEPGNNEPVRRRSARTPSRSGSVAPAASGPSTTPADDMQETPRSRSRPASRGQMQVAGAGGDEPGSSDEDSISSSDSQADDRRGRAASGRGVNGAASRSPSTGRRGRDESRSPPRAPSTGPSSTPTNSRDRRGRSRRSRAPSAGPVRRAASTPSRKRTRNAQLFASSALMRCVLCTVYTTRSVTGYVLHLKYKHGRKTPAEIGISFLCVCGHQSRSATHGRRGVCANISTRIVHDDGRIEEEVEEEESDEPSRGSGGRGRRRARSAAPMGMVSNGRGRRSVSCAPATAPTVANGRSGRDASRPPSTPKAANGRSGRDASRPPSSAPTAVGGRGARAASHAPSTTPVNTSARGRGGRGRGRGGLSRAPSPVHTPVNRVVDRASSRPPSTTPVHTPSSTSQGGSRGGRGGARPNTPSSVRGQRAASAAPSIAPSIARARTPALPVPAPHDPWKMEKELGMHFPGKKYQLLPRREANEEGQRDFVHEILSRANETPAMWDERAEQMKAASPCKGAYSFPIDFVIGSVAFDGDIDRQGFAMETLVKFKDFPLGEWVAYTSYNVVECKIKELQEFRSRAKKLQIVEEKMREECASRGQNFDDLYPARFLKKATPRAVYGKDEECRKRTLLRAREESMNAVLSSVGLPPLVLEDWTGEPYDAEQDGMLNFIFTNYMQMSSRVKRAAEKAIQGGTLTHKCNHGCSCTNKDVGTKCNCQNTKSTRKMMMAQVECGENCKCTVETCNNRDTQRGRQKPLLVIRHPIKKWTVRALEVFEKEDFVTEYVGELLTAYENKMRANDTYTVELTDSLVDVTKPVNAEAKAYQKKKGKKGAVELEEGHYHNAFVNSGWKKGNEGRFFSHSCVPNMKIEVRYIERTDYAFSRFVFIANKRIEIGSELTWTYQMAKMEKARRTGIKFTTSLVPECDCGTDRCMIAPLSEAVASGEAEEEEEDEDEVNYESFSDDDEQETEQQRNDRMKAERQQRMDNRNGSSSVEGPSSTSSRENSTPSL